MTDPVQRLPAPRPVPPGVTERLRPGEPTWFVRGEKPPPGEHP